MAKVIFHIDINCFYATCEISKDPTLKGKPVVVATENIKSVITTASYEARKYGVRSAMKLYEAQRKCRNLIVRKPDFKLYSQYSQMFFEHLKTYTKKVEMASIDEGYLDVTDLMTNYHALDLAKKIQDELLEFYELPVSIGIGPTRFLAKMASDMKKPLGITVLRKRDIKEILYPLDIKEVFGIGKKTQEKLRGYDINLVSDIVNADISILQECLGINNYKTIIGYLTGRSSDTLDYNSYDLKNIGNSKTYFPDLKTEFEVIDNLKQLVTTVQSRMENRKVKAKTFAIGVGFTDGGKSSKQTTLEEYTRDFNTMFSLSYSILQYLWNSEYVMYISVSANNIVNDFDILEEYTLFNYDNYDKILEEKEKQKDDYTERSQGVKFFKS